MIYICGPKDRPVSGNIILVNTTSSAKGWSRGLSPFLIGPVDLYKGFKALRMENAWQFSKVYPEHLGSNGEPTDFYWKWAKKGWSDTYAHRYPMGKGKKPVYSYWDGEKLGYIEARKKIYIPLYIEAVRRTKAFKILMELYKEHKELWLFDYDGYNHRSLCMSWNDVIHNPEKKMGHAFVLGMMLEGFLKF